MAHWRCLPDAAELDEPVREHRFHATRKWRFDLAWTRLKVAVELHGGTWKRKSGHNGAGVAKDAAKINAAQELGWKVFVFAGDQLKNMAENVMQVADFIRGQTC
ncbi:MAG: hypothetical protein EBR82_32935 [Caulobacteraceae bacterium]|nr:hypothetical protein [Caulobacteraceae bacterium]